jgi:cold shock CspA family protein
MLETTKAIVRAARGVQVEQQATGRVTFYDPDANYGFIEPDDGSGDVVFSLLPGAAPLATGDIVTYELTPSMLVTPMGKQALRVRKAGFSVPKPEDAMV